MFSEKVTTYPVITNYGCPKQLLIVELDQYNVSCSLHLYIKNGTFPIVNFKFCSKKTVKYGTTCWKSKKNKVQDIRENIIYQDISLWRDY